MIPSPLETQILHETYRPPLKVIFLKFSFIFRLLWIAFFFLSGAFFCHICKEVREKWEAEHISLALSGKTVNVEDVRLKAKIL